MLQRRAVLPGNLAIRIGRAHAAYRWDGHSPFCPGLTPQIWRPELELRLARPLPPDAISIVLPSDSWLVLVNEDAPVPIARWEASRAVGARLVRDELGLRLDDAWQHPAVEAFALDLIAPPWAVADLDFDAERVSRVLDLPPEVARRAVLRSSVRRLVYAT